MKVKVKMKAVNSYEMLVNTSSITMHINPDKHLNIHCCENLKSPKCFCIYMSCQETHISCKLFSFSELLYIL